MSLGKSKQGTYITFQYIFIFVKLCGNCCVLKWCCWTMTGWIYSSGSEPRGPDSPKQSSWGVNLKCSNLPAAPSLTTHWDGEFRWTSPSKAHGEEECPQELLHVEPVPPRQFVCVHACVWCVSVCVRVCYVWVCVWGCVMCECVCACVYANSFWLLVLSGGLIEKKKCCTMWRFK